MRTRAREREDAYRATRAAYDEDDASDSTRGGCGWWLVAGAMFWLTILMLWLGTRHR